jgi:predicted transcriptional regulator
MTTSATTIRPIAVKLELDIRERMKSLAVSRQRSTHWMMREAIAQYIEREEKLQSYRQDGLRAWNDYQDTGLHVSQDEADSWLAKLEAGQDIEPPSCHV